MVKLKLPIKPSTIHMFFTCLVFFCNFNILISSYQMIFLARIVHFLVLVARMFHCVCDCLCFPFLTRMVHCFYHIQQLDVCYICLYLPTFNINIHKHQPKSIGTCTRTWSVWDFGTKNTDTLPLNGASPRPIPQIGGEVLWIAT